MLRKFLLSLEVKVVSCSKRAAVSGEECQGRLSSREDWKDLHAQARGAFYNSSSLLYDSWTTYGMFAENRYITECALWETWLI